MSLQKYTDSLPKDKQFKVAIHLTKLALPIWERYADKNQLSYRDTVVGLTHTVNKELLKDAINEVEAYLHTNKAKDFIYGESKLIGIRRQFNDPIVALQDTDWELPYDVEKTFYSVYNLIDTLFNKEKTIFNESRICVSINQAADALETSNTMAFDEINKILDDIKNDV